MTQVPLIPDDIDRRFMIIATQLSGLSNDDRTKVGVCVVDKSNRVVSSGYNVIPDKIEEYFGHTLGSEVLLEKRVKYDCVNFAVQEAIVKNPPVNVAGCTLYTTIYPDSFSLKLMIASGIETFVYRDENIKPAFVYAKTLCGYYEAKKEIKSRQICF